MKKVILSFIVVLLAFQAEAQNSLLWKVEAPSGEISYLYGTYHLLGADYFKEKTAVLEAYKKSETVVVETIIDSNQLMTLASISLMPGKSLKRMTDSTDYLLLKDKLEPILGMDLAVFDMMKPMVLSSAYAVSLAEELTPDSLKYGGLPMDVYFAKQAEKEGKELMPLETMREQFEILFNSQSPEEQLEDLLMVIKDTASGEGAMTGILNSYFDNDLDGLYAASMEMESDPKDMEALVDQRNKDWVQKLEAPLNESSHFIAVGALHLPGENGLIELLEQKGFTLSPLN